jgi:hypothetical protein
MGILERSKMLHRIRTRTTWQKLLRRNPIKQTRRLADEIRVRNKMARLTEEKVAGVSEADVLFEAEGLQDARSTERVCQEGKCNYSGG